MKIISQKFYSGAFLFALAGLILPLFTHAQILKSDWVGSYEFFDAERSGPKNQPGNFVTYTLIVSENGNRIAARFTADGTQISDDYECRVEADGDSIRVFFLKDLGGTEEGKAIPLIKMI